MWVCFFFPLQGSKPHGNLIFFFVPRRDLKKMKNTEEHWTTVNSDRRGVMGAFVETCHHVFSFQSKLLWRKTKVLRRALMFSGVLSLVQY